MWPVPVAIEQSAADNHFHPGEALPEPGRSIEGGENLGEVSQREADNVGLVLLNFREEAIGTPIIERGAVTLLPGSSPAVLAGSSPADIRNGAGTQIVLLSGGR